MDDANPTQLDPRLTAKVRVYTPIPKGMRWFQADISGAAELVELFYCFPAGPDDPSRPHPVNIAQIRALYPDHDLLSVFA